MVLNRIDFQPGDRKLKQFAIGALFALPIVTWLAGAGTLGVLIAVVIAVGLVVMAWSWPRAIAPLFVAISLIALPIGWVLSEILLLLVYAGVFGPIGLGFRFLRRDALQLHKRDDKASYWQAVADNQDPKDYYKMY